MVFSSLIFVFVFFVIYLVAYRLASDRHKNAVLLVVSLVFYAWGGPEFLLLLVGETFVSWFCAVGIGRAESPGRRRAWLIADLAIMLGLLAYFKYAMWIAGTLQGLFGVPESIPNIVLPIGISFYTFQLISYTADVYMGKVEYQPAYWKLLLYSSLFFQCIAGPIVRYETVADDIDNRRVTQTDVYAGTRRFCIGLAKKAVLANACASVADTLLPVGTDGIYTQVTTGLWVGMLFYMLQIYFDFSAYSDMAIGMGRMVGFRFLENFDYPYSLHLGEGLLEALAHLALHVLPRLRLHPARRKPLLHAQVGPQHVRGVVPHGTVARRQLELHPLGPLLLRVPAARALCDQGPHAARPLARLCARGRVLRLGALQV